MLSCSCFPLSLFLLLLSLLGAAQCIQITKGFFLQEEKEEKDKKKGKRKVKGKKSGRIEVLKAQPDGGRVRTAP